MQIVTERKHVHRWCVGGGGGGERCVGSGRRSWDPKPVAARHCLPGVSCSSKLTPHSQRKQVCLQNSAEL